MIDRPVVWIDIESTGVDPMKDRIIDLGMVTFDPSTQRRVTYEFRFNPGIPISAEATAVHHITDADVKDFPAFSTLAGRDILDVLAGRDIGGYNVRRLDLPILDESLRRVDLRLNLDGIRIIDSFTIYTKKRPRRLEDAVREYCGREPSGAHGAVCDATDTLDVFLGQCVAYPDLAEMNSEQIAQFSRLSEFEYVDIAGKLYRDADGDARFAFGKNKDQKIRDHRDYCSWMIGASFPGSTLDAIEVEWHRIDQESPYPA